VNGPIAVDNNLYVASFAYHLAMVPEQSEGHIK